LIPVYYNIQLEKFISLTIIKRGNTVTCVTKDILRVKIL